MNMMYANGCRLALLLIAACSVACSLDSSTTSRSEQSHDSVMGLSASPLIIDLGRLRPGQVAQRIVAIKNNGNARRTVAVVETSCSCIAVAKVPQTLSPGEQRNLDITFDSSEEPGFRGDLAVEIRGLDETRAELFFVVVKVAVAPATDQRRDVK
jgi:hypothetical protein